MTEEEHVQEALDTLAELCKPIPNGAEDPDKHYTRKSAAEEILRHYREKNALEKGINVNLKIEGHVPVRPLERAVMDRAQA